METFKYAKNMEIKINWLKPLFYMTRLFEEYFRNDADDVFRSPELICSISTLKNSHLNSDTGYHFGSYRWRQYKNIGEYQWKCVWRDDFKLNHPIFTKLFKPYYKVPNWMYFKFRMRELGWKLKWGDYRYEYSPMLDIVLFGICISIVVNPPIDTGTGKYHSPDDYWESILWYQDYQNIDLVKEKMGKWKIYNNGIETERDAVHQDFLK